MTLRAIIISTAILLGATPAFAGPGDLSIRPNRPVVATGGSVNLAAYAEGHAAGTRARVRTAVWTANGGAVDDKGRFHAEKPGTYTVRALHRGRSASVTVSVVSVARLVHRVEIVPAVAHLDPGETVHARAFVYDRFGRRLAVPVQWAVPDGVTRNRDGQLKAEQPGRFEVRATVKGAKAVGVLRLTVANTLAAR